MAVHHKFSIEYSLKAKTYSTQQTLTVDSIMMRESLGKCAKVLLLQANALAKAARGCTKFTISTDTLGYGPCSSTNSEEPSRDFLHQSF